MKIAIIHDYFIQNGGAEKVIESLLELYPNADLYTSVYVPDFFKNNYYTNRIYEQGSIKTTFLNKIFSDNQKPSKYIKFNKHLYWLYPFAMVTHKVKGYDLVLISSTYCAKNVRLGANNKLVHYCHSPTRFLHGLVTEKDHSTLPLWQRIVSGIILNPILKIIDLAAVKNLVKKNCIWVANSKFIRTTINDVYHVDSDVIYPPVNINTFSNVKRTDDVQDFYLCHGRISFHKRLDLAILACLKLDRKLIISGQTLLESDMKNLKSLVPYDKQYLIQFLGRTSDETLHSLVKECKAMLFPGKEDAGIAPIELLAAGVPVIAYKSGGALEYIQDGVNGVFFETQDVTSLEKAILRFEQESFDIKKIKNSVLKFSNEEFKKLIQEI